MNDTTLPKAPRRKIKGVRKGFALHDWKLLLNSANDLAQRRGASIRSISMEEISLHNKVHDGWMVLHGKVYNVGPYLHYHPGGVDILKSSLGKDGTVLFEKYHRWVNVENLIGKLLLGYAQESTEEGQSQLNMPPPRPRKRQLEKLLPGGESESDDADDVNPWENDSE
mmetsp:Transcript_1617/g.2417  ORF Transcript_1617/g.2417 Transcript_1617/m.2417 type:complete len:168 (+) Transcript_1617:122-625(+)|eukprot:CAMPEP_0197247888 /NCGR_PEP_ID=MMETSP1429-20130617/32543_1 /TAXON_ID=49237 /ORGANISM="Chaetoceros  sp., Strain UNC1202" /LENGTH=167 /DNA_ID=CAMNT_0042708933 /DNA_START=65 /DNA_END=568 /DNA_ORIENTATION=+